MEFREIWGLSRTHYGNVQRLPHVPHHQKSYLPANNSTQMASSARYIDAASGTFSNATTTDAMISASETTDDVRFRIWGT